MKEVVCASVAGHLSAGWDLAVHADIRDCHKGRAVLLAPEDGEPRELLKNLESVQSGSDSPVQAVLAVKSGQMQGQAATVPPKSNLQVSTMT